MNRSESLQDSGRGREPDGVAQVQKRDGRLEKLQPEKISAALRKAFAAVGREDASAVPDLTARVVGVLESNYAGTIPKVEDVQDIVEQVLMERGYGEVAKAYILYRQQRAQVREIKSFIGVRDDLKLSVNAVSVLKRRYLIRDEEGNVVETPAGMLHRVAKTVAAVDARYGEDPIAAQEAFYEAMTSLDFLPNSPTLMNAGTEMGQLSACFVLPVEDSMESIFETLKHMALIHQSGGGTGFSFSRLRPKGDIVKSTKGVASGPVSFMQIYDAATSVVKQGGRRRGANMGILRVDHPDILEFITAKSRAGMLENFNISVAATDAFMRAVKRNEEYDLVNPRTGLPVRKLNAAWVFDLIVTNAWQTGDPGLAFIDRINAANPTPQIGPMESTNPCGEVPLLPYESCNLGSINLSRMVRGSSLDYDRLRRTVELAVHFLDNVIDANRFPIDRIRSATQSNRKIGLGVMGLADCLAKLEIPYDSEEALAFGESVMKFINEEAVSSSEKLAQKRGAFPNFEGSLWQRSGRPPRRNATVTSVAPTGTISIIAGTTSGIEPMFAVAYVREVMEHTRMLEVNPLFEDIAKKGGFAGRELMLEIAKQGSVQQVASVPDRVKRVFVTALDIAPEWHVRMQAAFQKHVDNAVAKTVNLPRDATPEDVRRIYLMAYELGCKGLTVYRYGSKPEQVLYVGSVLAKELGEDEHVSAESEYAGGCPSGACAF